MTGRIHRFWNYYQNHNIFIIQVLNRVPQNQTKKKQLLYIIVSVSVECLYRDSYGKKFNECTSVFLSKRSFKSLDYPV